MPAPGSAPTRLGFLTTGPFDPADPATGLEDVLRLVELGDALGLDTAWLRPDHLRHAVSSPVAMLAAASQRTRRIGLGTASIPVRAENPLRLAEDLATVDLLSRERLRPGLSVGNPTRVAAVDRAIHPTTAEHEEPGRERLLRFRDLLRGGPVPGAEDRDDERDDDEALTSTVQPASAGLADRLGYGAATLRTASWAGAHSFRLLASDVTERGSRGRGFAQDQRDLIDAYRAAHPDSAAAHVTLALVVVPTDGATAEQRARYAAARTERTARAARADQSEDPRAASSMVRAPDLVGPSDELAAALLADPAVQAADELAIALPAGLPAGDRARILTDVAERLGPALGWSPATT
ncbi:LLM class flavin-dependent oxidoreductase [Clavibacter nebraskensis]|uniref:Monooxygenase n=2 Tax=Clavibacter nebraskensis TaxID=31963 RepID=A0AAI9EJK3_9MICO|nr:LLM class flavin-dependent oxidoreductase [Clavibacter nebraskensis]KXU21606.1 luciferase [Clavibacter nebraskensis]OAH18343.1 luciferase [Clavibacter nebraskensis]QGV65889.1 LLM class flavin-dependent oxidoreductase [Clavibacter nebraskensis]QGV68686.1 LLM class flavin-dependent oxidoreductase [Clavibacter nebraskensis]QGV71477.1 LLM class flavin-dependent oxidoreductase [Clavibacter nebraskensis]